MKTAIDWLIEQTRTPEWHSLKRGEIIEQAKETEKQQIIDAYIEGYSAPENIGDYDKYYNETFTTNKETLK